MTHLNGRCGVRTETDLMPARHYDLPRAFAAVLALCAAAALPAQTAFAAGGGDASYIPKEAPKGDAAAGAQKAAACAACHGADGNSVNPVWPKIAGQNAKYLGLSLKAYRSGDRKNALMLGQAANLSDDDILNIAAHYTKQAQTPGVANDDAAQLELAEKLYRGGDLERGVPACLACHGPRGNGNPGTAYPRVGGQHADYTAIALNAYKSGERSYSANSQMMATIAAKLTDEEIAALANYLAGLQ